jgi:YHS domain-containing protein
MIRFIILSIVAYLLYRSIKSWIFPAASSRRSVSSKTASEIDDVMIKDPFCEAYFPKRNGVHLNFGGKDLYFCSNQCKDKYFAERSGKKS